MLFVVLVKSKIELVWDKNLITPSPILPQFLDTFARCQAELSKSRFRTLTHIALT